MPDWNRAFRDDFTEPDPLPLEFLQLVDEVELRPRNDFKTWRDAFLNDEYLGMVRVVLCGDTYICKDRDDMRNAIYCGNSNTLNINHKNHTLPVLRLRGICIV